MSIQEAICIVWLNGKELSPDLVRRINSVTIELRKNKADSGTMVLDDSDFRMFDSRLFRKGQAIHFLLGWINDAKPSGPYVIKTVVPDAPDNGNPTLTVKFQDLSHKMNKKQKRKRHLGKPAQILKKIAKENGLGYNISSVEGLTFTDDFPLIQASMTDAALIQRLADRYGYVWGIDGGTLFFRKPAEVESKSKLTPPVLSYRINDWSLRSFKPEFKFSSGRKKKKSKQGTSNIDLLGGKGVGGFLKNILAGDLTEEERKKLFDENPGDAEEAVLIEENIAKMIKKQGNKIGSGLGDEISDFYHEAVDSAERLISWFAGTGYTKDTDEMVRHIEEAAKIANPNEETTEDAEEQENEELQQGDESGAATPTNEDEAKRRGKGKLAKRAIITKADAVPTIGSMHYVPGRKVIIAGVGKTLSGGYLIEQVQRRYSRSGATFETPLKLSRTKVLPGRREQEAIQEVERRSAEGSLNYSEYTDLSGGTIAPENMRGGSNPSREIELALDSYLQGGGLKLNLIDGEEEL